MHERQINSFHIIVQLINRMWLAILVLILSLFMLANSNTQAATLLMDEGTNLRNNGSGNYAGTVGVRFLVGSVPLEVTSLGLWDGPNNGGTEGDGLQVDTDVGIWDNIGNLLASVSISSGSTGSFVNGSNASSVFAPITAPITLSPDTFYRIGALYTDGGNAFTNNGVYNSTSLSVTAGIFINGTSLSFPTSSDVNIPFGSATMQFSEVPVPGALWLFGSGLVAKIGFKRRLRK